MFICTCLVDFSFWINNSAILGKIVLIRIETHLNQRSRRNLISNFNFLLYHTGYGQVLYFSFLIFNSPIKDKFETKSENFSRLRAHFSDLTIWLSANTLKIILHTWLSKDFGLFFLILFIKHKNDMLFWKMKMPQILLGRHSHFLKK